MKIESCVCGRVHECPIDAVHIAGDALKKLAALCRPYQRILLVADRNTWEACGCRAQAALEGKARSLILTGGEAVIVPDENQIARIAQALDADTDLILGVGSGVINDLCKHVSFERSLPYMILATAPSMDGYASSGAALILGGMKVTLPARPPKAILADPAVLKDAPMDMIRAGWGDIVGKFSCLRDWRLAALLREEYFCPTIHDWVLDIARRVQALAPGLLAREESAVAALMQALVDVGAAMSYAGNSRPASGSEHHLSHFFEITGLVHHAPYLPHGIDVLYSSVVTAALCRRMAQGNPQYRAFDRGAWEAGVRRVYGGAADGVIALQDCLGWHGKDESAAVLARWEEAKKLLGEAPGEEDFRSMAEKIGLPMDDFTSLYGEEKIADAVRYAMDLKDRYTCLWLYNDYFA